MSFLVIERGRRSFEQSIDLFEIVVEFFERNMLFVPWEDRIVRTEPKSCEGSAGAGSSRSRRKPLQRSERM